MDDRSPRGAATAAAAPATDAELQSEVLESLSDARRYRRWLTDLVLPYLGEHPIEVGSGLGLYAQEWLTRVPKLTATEAHHGRLDRLRERFAAHPHVSVRELALPATDQADHSAAVAINVLEHIPDHVGALRSMGRLVRPGGAVAILVPAFPFAMSRFDRSIGHVRRYTRASLAGALTAAGLAPVEVRYVNPIGLFTWVVAVRFLHLTPRNGPLVRLFDRFAVPAQRSLERHLTPPFGQSVLGVARTPD